MTPSDKNLIERCEKRIEALKYEGYGGVTDLQQLLNRFKELAMVDLKVIETIVQTVTKTECEESQINPNAEADAEYLRAKIGYTTQHLNTEGEG